MPVVPPREIAPIRPTRSTGVPPDSPRSTSVNNPSCWFKARARDAPSSVLCMTTMRPAFAPERFAESIAAAHSARSSMPLPNWSTRSGN